MTARQQPPDVPGLGPLPEPADDEVVAALVRALNDDAEAITPSDRLADLRTAAARRRPSWPVVAAAAAAVVALASAIGVGLLGGGRDDLAPPARTPAPTVQTTPGPTSATSAPTTSPSPSGTSTGAGTVPAAAAVPVYYLGRDGDRLALYREFHRGASGDALRLALTAATDARSALDPDLTAPWLPGTVPVGVDGPTSGVVTVDLPLAEAQTRARTREQAALAVQALVFTVTAVQQDAGLGVRVLIGGKPGLLFGAEPVGDVVHRTSPAYQVLGSIWIESPEEDAVVPGDVTVTGTACVFEANVAWELRRGTTVVGSGHTTASSGCPDRGSWSVPLAALTPGTYTFRAYEPAPSGTGPDREQTRTFRVR